MQNREIALLPDVLPDEPELDATGQALREEINALIAAVQRPDPEAKPADVVRAEMRLLNALIHRWNPTRRAVYERRTAAASADYDAACGLAAAQLRDMGVQPDQKMIDGVAVVAAARAAMLGAQDTLNGFIIKPWVEALASAERRLAALG